MFYLKPVSPWCAITFSQAGRQILALTIATFCLFALCICTLMVAILFQIWRTVALYQRSAGVGCRPLVVTAVLVSIHWLTYVWTAISSVTTARVSTRYRFSHYLSYTLLFLLLLSVSEHWVFRLLYVGVRLWLRALAVRMDRAVFVYKHNETARELVDFVQRSAGCCGGLHVQQWHVVDWVPLRDSGFLDDQLVSRVYSVVSGGADTKAERARLAEGYSEEQLELAINISRKECPDCPRVVPWSCCNEHQNKHRCLDKESDVTWQRYNTSTMHNASCLLTIYGRNFYRHLLDWGILSELISWIDLLLALLLKYLDSATEDVIMSGHPRGKSKGYLCQRCCGWFCPKPGFLPERPPSTEPVIEELDEDEKPSGAITDILESVGNDWDRQMDEQLENERQKREGNRQQRLDELRQQKIRAKHEKKLRKLKGKKGVLTMPLLDAENTGDEEDDEAPETDHYADD